MDIRNNGKISPDVLKSMLDYDIPVLCNAKNDLMLLCVKYGDIKSLELIKQHFSFANAEEFIYEAFSSYELNDVIHRKNVDELLAITDIFIDAGKS